VSLVAIRLAVALAVLPIPARASLLAFEGRIVAVLPGFDEAEVARGTGVAQVDALQLGRLEVLAASIAGTASFPVTDPSAAPVTSLRVRASLPVGASLRIDAQAPPFGEPGLSGPFALPGEVQVCMLIAPLPPCVGGFVMPLTGGAGAAGVGVGGLLTIGGTGTLRLSLYGAPFTLNTAWVTGRTVSGATFSFFSAGSIAGPALFTSSAGQTGGSLSAVTPVRVDSFGSGAPTNILPGFLRLEIAFAPEPGVALLLSSGALSLLALERRRTRSRALRRERNP